MLRIETSGHASLTRAAAADAGGHVMITASHDKTARIWSLPDLRPLGVFHPPIGSGDDGKLIAAAVSPDGRIAAVSGWIGRADNFAILVFNVGTREVVRRLDGLPNLGVALAFSLDGKRLAVGLAGAHGVRVWNVETWQPEWSDPSYAADVLGLSFAPDGRLVTASLDGSLRLYVSDGTSTARVNAPPTQHPYRVGFSSDGSMVAVGFSDSTALEVRDGRTLALRWRPDTSGLSGGSLATVAWSPDGQTLYSPWSVPVGGHCPVFAWDRGGRGTRRVAANGSPHGVFGLIASPAGDLLLISSRGALSTIDKSGHLRANNPITVQNLDTSPTVAHVSRRLLLSADGTEVAWVANDAPARWLRFNVRTLALATGKVPPKGLADWSTGDGAQRLPPADWDDTAQPRLQGHAAALDRKERSRSIAVAPSGILLGADHSLRLFGANARLLAKAPLPAIAWRVNQSGDGRLAVAALDDGTLRWYRLPDLQELLALCVTADAERWIAWTPSGYYAVSEGGESLIGWQVNRAPDQAADFFSVGRFRSQYYRRGVIQRVLTTLDEREALQQADTEFGTARPTPTPIVEDLPPVLAIRSPAEGAFVGGQATIAYSVRSPSGKPIRSVSVRINGHAAPGVRTILPGALPQADGAAIGQVVVPIPPEPRVQLTLVAATDTKNSEPAKVTVSGSAERSPVPAPRGNLYALVIGPSYQARPLQNVQYADKDARDFAAVLKAQGGGALYKSVEVQILADRNANREAILRGLDWLVRTTTAEDTALLFLAGHAVTDQNGQFWFLPTEADPEHFDFDGIEGGRVKTKLGSLPSKVVVFVDACHAGSMFSFRAADLTRVANELADDDSGLVVFVSSKGSELSQELPELQHGAFTLALLRALRGGATDESEGLITISKLNSFLIHEVARLTNGLQHATWQRPNATDDYALFTRVAAEKVIR